MVNTSTTKGIQRRAIQLLLQTSILGSVLFVAAGDLAWLQAWVFLGLTVAAMAVIASLLLRRSPDLIAERADPSKVTSAWDKASMAAYGLSAVAILFVSGLDYRFNWSSGGTGALFWAGVMLFIVGQAWSGWAMVTNAFFASAVRIQEDRGHHVVSTGPYRVMRHPGYTGWILCNLAMPLLLGSWWAFIPGASAVAVLTVRGYFEDSMLQRDLSGYSDYAQDVRFRLVPGVW